MADSDGFTLVSRRRRWQRRWEDGEDVEPVAIDDDDWDAMDDVDRDIWGVLVEEPNRMFTVDEILYALANTDYDHVIVVDALRNGELRHYVQQCSNDRWQARLVEI